LTHPLGRGQLEKFFAGPFDEQIRRQVCGRGAFASSLPDARCWQVSIGTASRVAKLSAQPGLGTEEPAHDTIHLFTSWRYHFLLLLDRIGVR
jgi:hypothetical protein